MGRRTYGLTRSYAGVPADTRKAVREFARWLRRLPSVVDDIIVVNTPGEVVDFGGQQAFGAFQWQDTVPEGSTYVWIALASLLPDVCESEGMTREEGIDCLLTTLAHEFVHYEQWRRGGEPDEDEADNRGCDLVNTYYAHRRIPRTVAYPTHTVAEDAAASPPTGTPNGG